MLVRDFDYGRTSPLPDGRTLREWTLAAAEQEIEIAPGVTYTAWTLQRAHPRPDAARDRGRPAADPLRQRLRHPHTIHFHGIHPAAMDGVGRDR